MCERDFVGQLLNYYLHEWDVKLQRLHDPMYQYYRPFKKDNVPSLLNVITRFAEWHNFFKSNSYESRYKWIKWEGEQRHKVSRGKVNTKVTEVKFFFNISLSMYYIFFNIDFEIFFVKYGLLVPNRFIRGYFLHCFVVVHGKGVICVPLTEEKPVFPYDRMTRMITSAFACRIWTDDSFTQS